MSQADTQNARRIRNSVLGLLAVVLTFYFGIIALLIYRSHH